MVTTGFTMRSGAIFATCVLLSTHPIANAGTAEEAVDRITQKALSLDANPDRGATLFDQHCVKCHGSQAQGDSSELVPMLAGQRFAYLVRQMANFAGLERDSNKMHGVLSQIELRGPQSWVDLAAFLNRAPLTNTAQSGDRQHLGLGRSIFHEQCAGCHRADAGGDREGYVPSLRNQHYGYLARQMHKLADGRRHNVDEDLVRFLRGFDDEDVNATADYLSRLRAPRVTRATMRANGVVVD